MGPNAALSETFWEIGLKHRDALAKAHLLEETLGLRSAEQTVEMMHDKPLMGEK